MKDNQKIHLLSQELIPVINDVDPEAKQIILEHKESCKTCRKLYNQTFDVEKNIPKQEYGEDVEVQPFKKLAQFNTGLKLLLVAVRAVILFYLLYSGFSFNGEGSLGLEILQSGIFLFYIPAAVFLLIFTYIFFNKKWLWTSLLVDLVIIIFLDDLAQLFL